MINAWQSGHVYKHGDIVEHNGKLYQKADDNDQSPPDDVPGGWTPISGNNNAAEYDAIAAALGSYEQKVADHKAQVLAKLAAEGLSVDDVKAVLNA